MGEGVLSTAVLASVLLCRFPFSAQCVLPDVVSHIHTYVGVVLIRPLTHCYRHSD